MANPNIPQAGGPIRPKRSIRPTIQPDLSEAQPERSNVEAETAVIQQRQRQRRQRRSHGGNPMAEQGEAGYIEADGSVTQPQENTDDGDSGGTDDEAIYGDLEAGTDAESTDVEDTELGRPVVQTGSGSSRPAANPNARPGEAGYIEADGSVSSGSGSSSGSQSDLDAFTSDIGDNMDSSQGDEMDAFNDDSFTSEEPSGDEDVGGEIDRPLRPTVKTSTSDVPTVTGSQPWQVIQAQAAEADTQRQAVADLDAESKPGAMGGIPTIDTGARTDGAGNLLAAAHAYVQQPGGGALEGSKAKLLAMLKDAPILSGGQSINDLGKVLSDPQMREAYLYLEKKAAQEIDKYVQDKSPSNVNYNMGRALAVLEDTLAEISARTDLSNANRDVVTETYNADQSQGPPGERTPLHRAAQGVTAFQDTMAEGVARFPVLNKTVGADGDVTTQTYNPDEYEGPEQTPGEVLSEVPRLIVPGVDTSLMWDDMTNAQRAAALGIEVVGFLPFGGLAAKGVRAGMSFPKAAQFGAQTVLKGPVDTFLNPVQTVKGIGRSIDTAVNPYTVPMSALEATRSTQRLPVQEFADVQSVTATGNLDRPGAGAFSDEAAEAAKKASDEIVQSQIYGTRPRTTIGDYQVDAISTPFQKTTGPAVFSTGPNTQFWTVEGGSSGFVSKEGKSYFSPSYLGRFDAGSAFGQGTETGGRGGGVIVRHPEIIQQLNSSMKTFTPGRAATEVAEFESTLAQPFSFPETTKTLRTYGEAATDVEGKNIGHLRHLPVIDDPANPLSIIDLYKLKGRAVMEDVKRLNPMFRTHSIKEAGVLLDEGAHALDSPVRGAIADIVDPSVARATGDFSGLDPDIRRQLADNVDPSVARATGDFSGLDPDIRRQLQAAADDAARSSGAAQLGGVVVQSGRADSRADTDGSDVDRARVDGVHDDARVPDPFEPDPTDRITDGADDETTRAGDEFGDDETTRLTDEGGDDETTRLTDEGGDDETTRLTDEGGDDETTRIVEDFGEATTETPEEVEREPGDGLRDDDIIITPPPPPPPPPPEDDDEHIRGPIGEPPGEDPPVNPPEGIIGDEDEERVDEGESTDERFGEPPVREPPRIPTDDGFGGRNPAEELRPSGRDVEEFRRQGRAFEEGPRRGDTETIRPAQRPPGSYPRSIAHREQVEYSYNPENGEYSARVVDASEPVVTGWDTTPPDLEERDVGAWEVMPRADGVNVATRGNLEIPDEIKEKLEAQAEASEGVVSLSASRRYDHDLDTRETEARELRLGAHSTNVEATVAAIAKRANARAEAQLDRAGQSIVDAIKNRQAAQSRGNGRRRRSSKRSDKDLKQAGNLPQVVIVQEPMGRRIGGL